MNNQNRDVDGRSRLGNVVKSDTIDHGGVVFATVISETSSARKVTSGRFTDPGVDAVPVPGDTSLLVSVPQSGGTAFAGSVDTKNVPEAKPGERRQYSRDSDGKIVSTFWQYDDGSFSMFNENASILTESDGALTIKNKNVTISIDAEGSIDVTGQKMTITVDTVAITGDLTVTGDVIADGEVKASDVVADDGISLKDHTHDKVTVGTGVTGKPVAI